MVAILGRTTFFVLHYFPKKSTMTSFVRPIIASLLCIVIAIGQMPAWLHVAGCDHEPHLHLGSGVQQKSDACGCHHHGDDVATSEGNLTDKPLPHDHQHDSDTCAICQSLVAPTGIHWQLETLVVGQICVDSDRGVDLPVIASVILSTAQPRGPPARFA